MSKSNSKEYDKLKKIWYAKLKKSGFNDIEKDEDHLKMWSNKWARSSYVAEAPSREAYYYYATQFLRDHTFSNEFEKTLWEYHSNGLGCRAIAATLRKTGLKAIRKTMICDKIKILVNLMLKRYVKASDDRL